MTLLRSRGLRHVAVVGAGALLLGVGSCEARAVRGVWSTLRLQREVAAAFGKNRLEVRAGESADLHVVLVAPDVPLQARDLVAAAVARLVRRRYRGPVPLKKVTVRFEPRAAGAPGGAARASYSFPAGTRPRSRAAADLSRLRLPPGDPVNDRRRLRNSFRGRVLRLSIVARGGGEKRAAATA